MIYMLEITHIVIYTNMDLKAFLNTSFGKIEILSFFITLNPFKFQ